MKKTQTLGILGILLVSAAMGCKPEYPACDTDKDCKPNEFCVGRKCQQCRDNHDCAEGQECNNGRCAAIPGFCKSADQCPEGQACVNNRCRPCATDNECPAGLRCMSGRCSKPQCMKDEDCAQDQDCVNGLCVAAKKKPPQGPPCALDSVYFGFDKSNLTNEATATLAKNVTCLKKTEQGVSLVGRADSRGTTEYNMALSDRRAQSVKEYLQRMGVSSTRLSPVPRGNLDATGTDEAGMAKDRRVDSEWR